MLDQHDADADVWCEWAFKFILQVKASSQAKIYQTEFWMTVPSFLCCGDTKLGQELENQFEGF